MKKTLFILLALLFGVASVTTAFAKGTAAKTHSFTGVVASVDAGAKSLAVKGTKKEMTFDVANAKMVGFKALGDIKAGEKVTVKYTEKDGKAMAKSVAKATSKAHKKAPAAAKPAPAAPAAK